MGSGRWALTAVAALACIGCSAQEPTAEEAAAALRRAVTFYHSQVADHGGYVWRYSGDLSLREAEARTEGETVWVQPPGTPAVGMAFLTAWEATGEQLHLDAALDAANALVQGQMLSGGWYYSIHFDPEKRSEKMYRVDHPDAGRGPTTEPGGEEGWHVWRRREHEGNMTILDDNTTASAIRFLARLDEALDFEDERIHGAVGYGLESALMAQYPIGAWSHNYDRFPAHRPDLSIYPVLAASYPDEWSRTWTKDWAGCYYLNDNITPDMIAAMLTAYEVYDDERYLRAAESGGAFLLLAQMPEPQPAWCQQYDANMQPVWDRKFEPPAITGEESQGVLECLLLLYQRTGKQPYLEPVPQAIEYLRASALPDGKLARFYELKTNRPMYFTRDYEITYRTEDMPGHYSFQRESRLGAVEAEYKRLLEEGPSPTPASPPSPDEVRAIIDAMDERGAWVEEGVMDAWDTTPEASVIDSQAFIDSVRTLSEFIRASQ
ncbi:MAG: polysaccharide lyase [Armatimonadota bacterium]|nr:polysaccharide lyase [Armatimonadota bacterium]